MCANPTLLKIFRPALPETHLFFVIFGLNWDIRSRELLFLYMNCFTGIAVISALLIILVMIYRIPFIFLCSVNDI